MFHQLLADEYNLLLSATGGKKCLCDTGRLSLSDKSVWTKLCLKTSKWGEREPVSGVSAGHCYLIFVYLNMWLPSFSFQSHLSPSFSIYGNYKPSTQTTYSNSSRHAAKFRFIYWIEMSSGLQFQPGFTQFWFIGVLFEWIIKSFKNGYYCTIM